MPSPIVFSDVNYLSTTAPQSAAEWSSFLRPLRGREPEGMWNLLSIVREMYKRNDRNSLPLLEIVTLQCLETAQIMIWWFNTKVMFRLKQRLQLLTSWYFASGVELDNYHNTYQKHYSIVTGTPAFICFRHKVLYIIVGYILVNSGHSHCVPQEYFYLVTQCFKLVRK